MFRYTTFATLGIVLFAGIAHSQDRPRLLKDPEQRKERREKIFKKLDGVLGKAAEAGEDADKAPAEGPGKKLNNLFQGILGGGDQTPIDIGKLNKAFGGLFDSMLEGNAQIESIRFQFDPKESNLEKDRLRVNINVVLRKSAWSKDPSRIAADLGFYVDRSTGMKFVLDGRVNIQTDVIGLADYLVARAKQKAPTDELGDLENPPPPDVRQRIEAKLRDTLGVATLDDVADLVAAVGSMQIQAANDKIEWLKRNYVAAETQQDKDKIAGEIFSTRRQRDLIFANRLRIIRDESGQANMVTLQSAPADSAGLVQIEKIDAAITDSEVNVQFAGSTSQGVPIYTLVKPFIMRTLQRFQAGEDGPIRTFLKQGIEISRPFLDGEGVEREPAPEIRNNEKLEDVLPAPNPEPAPTVPRVVPKNGSKPAGEKQPPANKKPATKKATGKKVTTQRST